MAFLGPACRRQHRARPHHGRDRVALLGPAVGPLRDAEHGRGGAVLFAAAGAWPLASAGGGPAYAAVVLPSMLLWAWPTRSSSRRCSPPPTPRRARSWRRGQRCWPWHACGSALGVASLRGRVRRQPGNGPGRVRPCLDRSPDHRGHDRLRRPAAGRQLSYVPAAAKADTAADALVTSPAGPGPCWARCPEPHAIWRPAWATRTETL